MLDETLASRFDLSDQVTEDKVGRHTAGKRTDDDFPIVLTVLDPQLKVSQSDVAAAASDSRQLSGLMLSTVLHCLEVGRTEGGNLYLVSERAEFETLKARVRSENGLSAEEALAVAYRVADVLRSASGAGIHHQDLSSTNIGVDFSGDSPKVRVGRYGFAHLMQPYAPTRKNEPFYGTAEYMAPEVCSGRPADAAADLYALGILMYEMIAGKPPFVSSSPSTTIKRQVYEKPLPLHLVKPGTSNLEAYEKLVTSLLSKDPKGRPADATGVMEAISALASEAFPDTNLDIEPGRESAAEVASTFEESAGDEQEEAATPAAGGDSRETMVFTGLAGQVAGAMAPAEGAPEADAGEPATEEPAVEASSQPTEAFDPSMVKDALKELGKADGEEGGDESEAAPAAAAAPGDTDGDGAKPEDWFVDRTDQLPESAFPAEEEAKKESRMFWVIVGAVAILVGVGAAIYFDGGKQSAPEPPKPVVVTPPPVEPKPAPKPEPAVVPVATPTPAAAEEAAPDPGPAAAPDPGPPVPTPEEIRAREIEGKLAEGRAALEGGDLEKAGGIADGILAEAAGHEGASALKNDVEAAREAIRKEAERKAKEKARKKKKKKRKRTTKPAPAVEKKPKAKPEKKPEAKPSAQETQKKLRGYIRTGRDAYKKGDYKAAIRNYQKALDIDKNNALVRKLLDQAKAKASP